MEKKKTKSSKPISLQPLKFDEAVSDLLKVKPEEKKLDEIKRCPVESCPYESQKFIDLLRHMVESERHKPIGHQDWFMEALGKEFAPYAFAMDKRIAHVFERYCCETKKQLPAEPEIFYEWLSKQKKLMKLLEKRG